MFWFLNTSCACCVTVLPINKTSDELSFAYKVLPQPLFLHNLNLFVFLQSEADSDKNALELGNKFLISETKLNPVNTKTTSVYRFKKNTNI